MRQRWLAGRINTGAEREARRDVSLMYSTLQTDAPTRPEICFAWERAVPQE